MSKEKKIETKSAAMVKAAFYLVAAIIIYFLVFSNAKALLEILTCKTYVASLVSMGIAVSVAFIYGTAISKFFKHTLEKALESQILREE
ncbi:hypothetical protein [Desulfolucanica intricata]|uniref:hypothetical protein n=1 Tax=Desulfolucanica intricata TaxID=1285191 RepID=UPI000829FE62|nr:hypothetical protein [Desulfolucanica intricata]